MQSITSRRDRWLLVLITSVMAVGEAKECMMSRMWVVVVRSVTGDVDEVISMAPLRQHTRVNADTCHV
ncbi:hypothetical protein EB73_06000 [Mycobacterium sp. SWH-M3]|nr:hypothetical protein EB73_06000 [Mycobacterium sp. SWH-M3]